MFKERSIFKHRYGVVAIVYLLVCGISFITRVILLIKSWSNAELSVLRFADIFFIGLFYDLVVSSFFAIPVALYCWLMKDSWYQRKWQRIPLFLLLFIITFILVAAAGSEIIFWNEFNVRFNFIAVDYLIYTNEVLGNIWESYNMPLIIAAVALVVFALLLLVRKKVIASKQVSMHFKQRTVFFLCFLLLPAGAYFLVNDHLKNTTNNNYVNELSGNGIYEFGAAFWNNEIDYHSFYKESSEAANFGLLRKMLQAPNATFTTNPLSIERQIGNDSPAHQWNIVLITRRKFECRLLKVFR